MPQYQYRCPSCRSPFTVNDNVNIPPCPVCNATSKRVWNFTSSPSFPEHFNHAVGEHVNTRTKFYDLLKAQSELASIRSGREVDYQPIDPSEMADPKLHGVTEEGLEDTFRATYVKD